MYLHFIVGISKSVSLRIAYEIFFSKNKEISKSSLKTAYPLNELFYKRIDLLIANKWLISKNDDLSCSKKSELLVFISIFFRKILRIKASG